MNPDTHIWTSTDFGLEGLDKPTLPNRLRTFEEMNAQLVATELRKVYEEERRRTWHAAEEAVKAHSDLSISRINDLTDQVVALKMRIAELEQELYGLYTDALSE